MKIIPDKGTNNGRPRTSRHHSIPNSLITAVRYYTR
jgi:hypothetical protein